MIKSVGHVMMTMIALQKRDVLQRRLQDIVDAIINNDNYKKNLIFTNTSNSKE